MKILTQAVDRVPVYKQVPFYRAANTKSLAAGPNYHNYC